MSTKINEDSDETVTIETECDECDGDGYTVGCDHGSEGPDDREEDCENCDGSGTIEEDHHIVELINEYGGEYQHEDGTVYVLTCGLSYTTQTPDGDDIDLVFFVEEPDRSVGINGGYCLEEVDGESDRDMWPACALDPAWVDAAYTEATEEER